MKQSNTLGRCCIAAACIMLGISETQASFAPIVLFQIICGIFLFVNYKVQIAVPILIGIRILAILYHPTSIFENVAIIGGLLLLLDKSGKSLLEIMEPDIRDLPEYKTKF